MKLGRILSLVSLAAVISLPAVAQETMRGDLSVSSDPPGAQVSLTGGVKVGGVTPTRFRYLLHGKYDLEVKKSGYETYSTSLMLHPSQQADLQISLSPKTRFKAAARSLFVPGWGQRYGEQKTKGWAITILAAGAAAGYFIADNKFENQYDEFERAVDRFDAARAAGDIQEMERLQPILAEEQEEAYDAENIRRAAVGVIIGVWGLNVLDALFFFPSWETSPTTSLSMEPSTDFNEVGINLSLNF